MFRTSAHTKWAGYSYEYNHEDYVNGFGEANFDTPYWLGLTKMKRITGEERVDLVVFYDDYFDVFLDFKLLHQGFRMTYSHFEGAAGGIMLIVICYSCLYDFSVIWKCSKIVTLQRNPKN